MNPSFVNVQRGVVHGEERETARLREWEILISFVLKAYVTCREATTLSQ